MIVVIPVLAYWFYPREADQNNTKMGMLISISPFFILGFIGFGLIRTIGDWTMADSGHAFWVIKERPWLGFIVAIKSAAVFCLAVAMSAVGLNTNINSFKTLGLRPFYFGFLIASFVGMVSIAIIKFLII